MSIYDQIAHAIPVATTHAMLDELARLTWRGLAEGLLDEEQASFAGEAVEARRALFRAKSAFPSAKDPSGPRRAPRSPDRQRSIERRRRIAASGAIPPAIAARFTGGEVAVLSIVAREIQRRGRCELPIDAIAALAGVSRSTVRNAMSAARDLGILTIMERRRRGRPSDTNLVSIIDPAWRAWLRLAPGASKEGRAQNATHHGYKQCLSAKQSIAQGTQTCGISAKSKGRPSRRTTGRPILKRAEGGATNSPKAIHRQDGERCS